jgi:glycosyltransferase involved in cell wall biosynthesis
MSVKILHIIGAMNRGGVESWLMHLLRNMDRTRFQMDFLVHTHKSAAYDTEIQTLGSCVIPCPNPHNPILYLRRLCEIFRDYGPYDVVHSHVHHFSGWVLRIAKKLNVPIRIAHSHSDTSQIEKQVSWERYAYLRWMEHLIDRYATVGLAASCKAAAALWGSKWYREPRWKILYCGVNLELFRSAVDRTALRSEVGIPENAFVLGHVGRMEPVKNHSFLLKILQKLVQRDKNVRLLLIGDGSLRRKIEVEALEFGIRDYIIFLGNRDDVSRLLIGAVDLFIFPSLYEGLPLSVVEAQAAGLPIIISDSVTREVDVVPGLLTWLSLSEPASVWAEVMNAICSRKVRVSQSKAPDILEQSPFNIQVSARQLEQIYGGVTD